MGSCTSSVKTGQPKGIRPERRNRGFGVDLDTNLQKQGAKHSKEPFVIHSGQGASTQDVPDLDHMQPDDYALSDVQEPQMVARYIDDVTNHQRKIEADFMPRAYLSDGTQGTLSKKARGCMVNWLVEVHYKLRLKQETLPLTVNIMDRYLSITPVDKGRLQLVGAASLWVASKWVDIYPPTLKDMDKVASHARIWFILAHYWLFRSHMALTVRMNW